MYENILKISQLRMKTKNLFLTNAEMQTINLFLQSWKNIISSYVRDG